MGDEFALVGCLGAEGVEDVCEDGPTEGAGDGFEGVGKGGGFFGAAGVDVAHDDAAVLMTGEAFEGDRVGATIDRDRLGESGEDGGGVFEGFGADDGFCVREGREGFAEGEVEVDGSGIFLKGAVEDMDKGLAEVSQGGGTGVGQWEFSEGADLIAEVLDLVDGLAGAAMAFIGGAVGGEDQEGGTALVGFRDGGGVVCDGGTGGANKGGRATGALGDSEGEEGGGAFVEDGDDLEFRVAGGGINEGGGTRPRGNNDGLDAEAGKDFHCKTAPDRIGGAATERVKYLWVVLH